MTEDVVGKDSDVVRRDRFSGGPAREFLSSLAADERLFEADLAVDRAHVVMLTEQGIIDADDAGDVLAALDEVEAAGHASLAGEDVHAAIETAVVDRAGPAGARMHTARSRNDEVATCIRYRLREDLLDAVEATLALRRSLLDVAAANRETVMPGFTHLQPAQPTTLAHYCGSYAGALERDTARLLDAYGRVNESPLGAAAFAGTPFDVDRERTADLLGFDGLVENAMDAVSGRNFLLETASALATLATTLSGLAEDLLLFANRGWMEPADDYASTSSIMPQKKNPDTLELVRATAGDAHGTLSGLLTTLTGLPRAYNRDLQRATPHAWDAVDTTSEAAEVAAGAVTTATWEDEAFAAAADEGFSTATGVADALAMQGVPFRIAHEAVAKAAEANGGETPSVGSLIAALEDTLDGSLDSTVDRESLTVALDPATSIEQRDSRGGPAPEAVATQLDRAEDRYATDRDAVEKRHQRLADASARRQAAVDRYR
ncbi:MAG TPA: argininosuccinate lyase [Natrialbaceae archaeon]|nr:argininosuccinate lyase [Natrialbaceae archaeon]